MKIEIGVLFGMLLGVLFVFAARGLSLFIERHRDSILVHVCLECKEEFSTERRLVDHLNEVHDYGWSYEEFHQICGSMYSK